MFRIPRRIIVRIGYACLTLGNPDIRYRKIRLQFADVPRLREVCLHNLNMLERAVQYNIKNNIGLFRMTSDLIPFASAIDYPFSWKEAYREQFKTIGETIKRSGMRVSMHPGQYTVLNSPTSNIVTRAVTDISYHCDVLDLLGCDASCKIILHVGGVYGNKAEAVKRFIRNFETLPSRIRNRIAIENDQRCFTAEEVLDLAKYLKLPAVFDNLHHAINPSVTHHSDAEWIALFAETWKKSDGKQKIHYAQQAEGKRVGAHSDTITASAFVTFCDSLKNHDIDIMLEVKDKDLSAIKCMHCMTTKPSVQLLEQDWAKYKYNVLEHSPNSYRLIRRLLGDKNKYPAFEFFALIEESMKREPEIGNAVNAAEHVWGYYKKNATNAQVEQFFNLIEAVQRGEKKTALLKKYLYRMQKQYRNHYLSESYYFIL